jgi:bacterioferritin (cytochrome b1)
MAQCVAHELKQQLAYVYYAESIMGPGRGELAEIFKDHAASELKDASYLLQRIAAIQPGGVPIPPSPMPVPTSDPQQALQILIAGEAHAVTLLQTLRQVVEGDPMQYAVEAMISEEQGHHDVLSRFVVAPTTQSRIKSAQLYLKRAAAAVIPTAGEEPAEQYLSREQALAAQQHEAEEVDAAARVEQLSAALEAKATELSNATLENEGLQQQMAQQQQVAAQSEATAQQSAMQAQQAMQQATEASAQTAVEADAKMRLAMRIQQFRQQLAQLAASDPVGEELGAAAGGAPMTPQQGVAGPGAAPAQQTAQATPQDAAAAAASEQQAAAAQGGPEAAVEVSKAQEAGAKAQGAAADAATKTQPSGRKTSGLSGKDPIEKIAEYPFDNRVAKGPVPDVAARSHRAPDMRLGNNRPAMVGGQVLGPARPAAMAPAPTPAQAIASRPPMVEPLRKKITGRDPLPAHYNVAPPPMATPEQLAAYHVPEAPRTFSPEVQSARNLQHFDAKVPGSPVAAPHSVITGPAPTSVAHAVPPPLPPGARPGILSKVTGKHLAGGAGVLALGLGAVHLLRKKEAPVARA